ncbi:Secretin RcpA/CpaC-like protein, associated with Flp pilus assembly [Candidatus Liberibacter solanacearum]|uniref:pilus assembly protein N-terminal domain-containing protein n=1 Tax=Candidatus Liberibacter solanacearum TaxID=556287 RepID=UPI003871562D
MARIQIALVFSTIMIAYSYPAFSNDETNKNDLSANRQRPILPSKHAKEEKKPILTPLQHEKKGAKPTLPLKHARPEKRRNEIQKNATKPRTTNTPSPQPITNDEKRIRIAIGQSIVLKFDSIPSEVIIGNDQITDVLALEKEKSIVITGKKSGLTNIIVLGAGNKVLLETDILSFPNEHDTVRVYTPKKLSFLSCTPRCLPNSENL